MTQEKDVGVNLNILLGALSRINRDLKKSTNRFNVLTIVIETFIRLIIINVMERHKPFLRKKQKLSDRWVAIGLIVSRETAKKIAVTHTTFTNFNR